MQDAHPRLDPAAEPDYRALERGYHRSADYAAMVERYPLLRRSIESCRGSALVGCHTNRPHSHSPGVLLQWERSHGEG